jgi:hypothetical protein
MKPFPAASLLHWCPMSQRLSPSPSSAVDVMGVVFTRRAVGRCIPDRVGNRVNNQMVLHVLPQIHGEPLVIWIHVSCRRSFVIIFFSLGITRSYMDCLGIVLYCIVLYSCCFHFYWSIGHPWNIFVSLQFLNLGESVGLLDEWSAYRKAIA